MLHRKAQQQIAILVPARNEELVLAQTLISALKLVKKPNLYVVDDGSIDRTYKTARKFTKNVLRLNLSLGKAKALNQAIAYFKLAKKYKFIFPVDADTKISPDFLEKSLKILNEDKDEKYICSTGKVTGECNNWLTSYRVWEYEVAQLIHKSAQSKQNAIVVCPGCATIYRSKLFLKTQIPQDTIVEDMDLTFLIHRKKLGQILFTPKASVVTQDPYTLKDYLKQIIRWYRGYWQCLRKHNVPWGRQALDFELALQTIEGLAGGLMVSLVIVTFPFILQKQPSFLLIPLLLDFILFFLPTIFLTVFVQSSLKILKYLPAFYFVRILNSIVFLYIFFESLIKLKIKDWNQVSRYLTLGGRICTVR